MSNDRHAVMTKGLYDGECIRIPDQVSLPPKHAEVAKRAAEVTVL